MNDQYILAGFAALALLGVVLAAFLYDLRRRFFRVFAGRSPGTHEEVLGGLLTRSEDFEGEIAWLKERLDLAEETGKRSFQKIGFIRYNPFSDTGGDQSFSLALLDGDDNGFVISSLYGREGTRIYAKAIERGTPKQPLSEEEKIVLERARQKN